MSIRLEAEDHSSLPRPLPGQYLTVRIPGAAKPTPMRSYSLLGDPSADDYRISVKREDQGLASRWLHANIEPGSVVEAAAPRGDFYLTGDSNPVVLISAGIGITPVLAMLHTLSSARSTRDIWWLHATRNLETHAFAAEVTALIDSLPHARRLLFYTETQGRPDQAAIAALGLPADATAYLCGPTQFMTDMRDALTAIGLDSAQIHSELFGALPPINPGIVDGAPRKRPHPPAGTPGAGPSITFARSGLTVNWSADYRNILDLAEACDVPTRFSCRSGVCHMCVTGVVAGTVTYVQSPLEKPNAGEVLICSAAPGSDLVLDL
jgi:ferredoxin-NADP reductase